MRRPLSACFLAASRHWQTWPPSSVLFLLPSVIPLSAKWEKSEAIQTPDRRTWVRPTLMGSLIHFNIAVPFGRILGFQLHFYLWVIDNDIKLAHFGFQYLTTWTHRLYIHRTHKLHHNLWSYNFDSQSACVIQSLDVVFLRFIRGIVVINYPSDVKKIVYARHQSSLK